MPYQTAKTVKQHLPGKSPQLDKQRRPSTSSGPQSVSHPHPSSQPRRADRGQFFGPRTSALNHRSDLLVLINVPNFKAAVRRDSLVRAAGLSWVRGGGGSEGGSGSGWMGAGAGPTRRRREATGREWESGEGGGARRGRTLFWRSPVVCLAPPRSERRPPAIVGGRRHSVI